MTALLGWALCALGMALLLVAAIGVARFPDALARQHAATKAGTVAVTVFAIGAALIAGEWGWLWRLGAVVILLLATLPLASHALSRAAALESGAQAQDNQPR